MFKESEFKEAIIFLCKYFLTVFFIIGFALIIDHRFSMIEKNMSVNMSPEQVREIVRDELKKLKLSPEQEQRIK